MKKIVCYFSASGVTAKRAKELAGAAGADLLEIRPETPYTKADLDWTDKTSRSTAEMTDPASRPALAEARADLASYDTVYIGFPIWWGVAPRVINTFIESNDLTGKEIMIFATSGGSGITKAVDELQKSYPSLKIRGGKLLNGAVKADIL